MRDHTPPPRFADVGTERYPLWASQLDALLACSWRFVGGLWRMWDDIPGEPADTSGAGRFSITSENCEFDS